MFNWRRYQSVIVVHAQFNNKQKVFSLLYVICNNHNNPQEVKAQLPQSQTRKRNIQNKCLEIHIDEIDI